MQTWTLLFLSFFLISNTSIAQEYECLIDENIVGNWTVNQVDQNDDPGNLAPFPEWIQISELPKAQGGFKVEMKLSAMKPSKTYLFPIDGQPESEQVHTYNEDDPANRYSLRETTVVSCTDILDVDITLLSGDLEQS